MEKPARIGAPAVEAEGIITGEIIPGVHEQNGQRGLAYNSTVVGPDGVALHIWMGFQAGNRAALQEAVKIAKAHRDVVRVTYSSGSPSGFWACSRMGWDT